MSFFSLGALHQTHAPCPFMFCHFLFVCLSAPEEPGQRPASFIKFAPSEIEKVLQGLGWEDVPNLQCPFCSSGTRIIPSLWMMSNGWKEAEYGAHVKQMDETCGSRSSILYST